ncbi:MAG: FixH family protein [Flavobacteriales bacterium]|nr:FixH family protein [Flavobacteriales bacterium]MCB9198291.1 FixH family protein [Flavobacteriales bacterium]
MKFNWGIGITIVIIAFMTFILSFVFRAAQTNSDLYAEDYYDQEIKYQETINAKNNAIDLKKDFKFNQSSDYFLIQFPTSINDNVEGKVYFYRPEDASKDKTFKLALVDGIMGFDKSDLDKGGYVVKISWQNGDKDYLIEQQIAIE